MSKEDVQNPSNISPTAWHAKSTCRECAFTRSKQRSSERKWWNFYDQRLLGMLGCGFMVGFLPVFLITCFVVVSTGFRVFCSVFSFFSIWKPGSSAPPDGWGLLLRSEAFYAEAISVHRGNPREPWWQLADSLGLSDGSCHQQLLFFPHVEGYYPLLMELPPDVFVFLHCSRKGKKLLIKLGLCGLEKMDISSSRCTGFQFLRRALLCAFATRLLRGGHGVLDEVLLQLCEIWLSFVWQRL